MPRYMTLDNATIYLSQKEYKRNLLEKIDKEIQENPTITIQEVVNFIKDDEIEQPGEALI